MVPVLLLEKTENRCARAQHLRASRVCNEPARVACCTETVGTGQDHMRTVQHTRMCMQMCHVTIMHTVLSVRCTAVGVAEPGMRHEL